MYDPFGEGKGAAPAVVNKNSIAIFYLNTCDLVGCFSAECRKIVTNDHSSFALYSIRILTTRCIDTVWLPGVFLKVRTKRSFEWIQAVILGMVV